MKYESAGERAERVDTQAGLLPDLGDLWLLWCLGASGKGQKVPPILKRETSAQERASHKDCCIESKEGSSVRMWEIVGMVLATNSKNVPWRKRGQKLLCMSYFKARTEQCNWWNTQGEP